VTWAFAYFATLIVGFALASVTGLLRDLRALGRHHRHLAEPAHERHLVRLGGLGRGLAVALVFFGILGLPLSVQHSRSPALVLAGAAVSGLVGFVLASVFLSRRARADSVLPTALVVHSIPRSGYGVVQLADEDESNTRATRGADASAIPAGTSVEITDASRSVLVVRPVAAK
jgi:hypothetical protein